MDEQRRLELRFQRFEAVTKEIAGRAWMPAYAAAIKSSRHPDALNDKHSAALREIERLERECDL